MSVRVREDLLAAAKQHIDSCGYAGTSIADVAATAGILKGNVAYYFRTKADLLREVVAQRSADMFALLEAGDAEDDSPLRAIGRFITMVERSAAHMAKHGCPVGSLAGELGKSGEPELQRLAAQPLIALRDWLRAKFTLLIGPDSAGDAAEQLLCGAQGAATLAHATADPNVVHRRMAEARRWIETVASH